MACADVFQRFVEAKWGSPIGVGQGVGKAKSQVELRQEFLAKVGSPIYGRGVACAVVTVGAVDAPASQVEGVTTASLAWDDLLDFGEHPHRDEFGRYLSWKREHGRVGRGVDGLVSA